MFDRDRDLSRGLCRGENVPPENFSAEPPTIYTAYTQPAGASYNTIPPADCPPAIPPQPEPKRRAKKSHVTLIVLLVVLAVLLGMGLYIATHYDISIGKSDGGFHVDIRPRGEVVTPDSAVTVYPQPDGAQTLPSAPVGSGVSIELTETPAESQTASGGVLSFSQIYKKCSPSVVGITTLTDTATFSGTGIIISGDGYVITNSHVIEGGLSITVKLEDGKEYEAALVGQDTISDLAVLNPAEFGDSDATEVGDEVAAIGNPYGQDLTMTNGIISAINRDIKHNGNTMTLLQTNTAINEGNSGGPLINIYGQIIGITNMKLISAYTQIEGIGYAIPSATVKAIVDELIENGYIAGRPGIGVTLEEIPQSALIYYGLPKGLYVRSVEQNSDAWAKGVRIGDIVTAINGEAVTTTYDVAEIKNRFSAGDSITMTVYRAGAYNDVEVVLMDMNLFN